MFALCWNAQVHVDDRIKRLPTIFEVSESIGDIAGMSRVAIDLIAVGLPDVPLCFLALISSCVRGLPSPCVPYHFLVV